MRKFEETFGHIIEDCNNGRINQALEGIKIEWNMLESPKAQDGLMPLVVDHCLRVCEYFDLNKVANDIAQMRYVGNVLRIMDIGQDEFMMGKIAYQQQNLEVAKQLFLISNKLSNGATLKAEHYKKYRDLIFEKVAIPEEQSLGGRIKYYLEISIISEVDKSNILKEFDKILVKWEKLSEPKIFKAKSYELIKQFVLTCIEYKLYDLGNEIIGLLLSRATKHEDDGESEYIAGRLAFKQDNLVVAQQFFWVSNFKSKGTIFIDGSDNKYIELINMEDLDLNFDEEKYGISKAIKVVSSEEDKNTLSEEENLEELPPELYKQIVDLYEEADKLEGDVAIKKYQSAIELLPGNVEDWEISKLLYAAIGDVYIIQKDFNEAFNYFTCAYNCEGMDNPYILLNLGVCAYELDDMKQATEYFMRAYMLEGTKIFEGCDEKYFKLIEAIV